LVRQGLKKILSEELGTVSYGEAGDGTQVLEHIRNEDWDILILDITMPGKSGFDIVAALREERPDLPILVLSMHSEDQYAIRLLKAGVAGYLTKGKAPTEVVAAVKKVLAGEKYISPSFAEKLVLDLATGNWESQHGTLSQREFQVLRMIASGKTLTGTAESLSLSVKTVSTYRARILDKLKLRTNDELTDYAVRNRII
jgi:DNA-binding NarL/FixJ family response regulator